MLRAGLLAVVLITLGVAACGGGGPTGPNEGGMGMPDDDPMMVIQKDGKAGRAVGR